jgi:hypothetical protein
VLDKDGFDSELNFLDKLDPDLREQRGLAGRPSYQRESGAQILVSPVDFASIQSVWGYQTQPKLKFAANFDRRVGNPKLRIFTTMEHFADFKEQGQLGRQQLRESAAMSFAAEPTCSNSECVLCSVDLHSQLTDLADALIAIDHRGEQLLRNAQRLVGRSQER